MEDKNLFVQSKVNLNVGVKGSDLVSQGLFSKSVATFRYLFFQMFLAKSRPSRFLFRVLVNFWAKPLFASLSNIVFNTYVT